MGAEFTSNRLRILYITQYYPPEIGATQTRAFEMVRYLVDRGHRVTVLTEFPNHPSGIIPQRYKGKWFSRERDGNLEVIRTWVFTRPEKTFWSRIAFYLSFCLMSVIRGIVIGGTFDAVYATSPPLFVGLSGLIISLWKRTRFVLEIRDLWPESAVALKEISNPSVIRLAEGLERFLYHRACRIVGVTKGFLETIQSVGISPKKLHYIPNGANLELYTPGPKRISLRKELGIPASAFVVMYTGIHGLMHGLEFVIRSAAMLQENRNIFFVFIGEGVIKQSLIAEAEERGLKRILFLDSVPEEALPDYIRTFDAGLVTTRDLDICRRIISVKMFTYMACEKPVIACIEGEALSIVLNAEAGIYAEPENPEALVRAVLKLSKHPGLCKKLGRNGRDLVSAQFSRKKLAAKLENVLQEVVLRYGHKHENESFDDGDSIRSDLR